MSDTLKSSYSFELPEELIAHQPVAQRESCKLLTLDKGSGELAHKHFYELEQLIPANSVLVLNDTRVIHARIPFKRSSGGIGEVLIQKKTGEETGDESYVAVARPSKRLKEGEIVQCLKNTQYSIRMNFYIGDGVWNISIEPEIDYPVDMSVIGELPLPPYIKREAGTTESDEEDYQTVFSKTSGSVAAPTASLHFSKELLEKIKERGIQIVTLTHHVGLGTFYPIRVENVEEHNMHTESYSVPTHTSETIVKAKSEGRKIIAVGTTVVRALESSAEKILSLEEVENQETDLFIYPTL